MQRTGFTGAIAWEDPKGAVLLNEQRTVLVLEVEKAEPAGIASDVGITAIRALGQGVGRSLGFALLRPRRCVFRSPWTQWQLTNASEKYPGEVVRGDERNVPAAWCAYSAAPEGKPVTVAAFGHPDNVRGPATWFTMANAFAYMSATLNLYKEPLKLTADKPFVLRYAVAAWDGKIESSQIDKLYHMITWSKSLARRRCHAGSGFE